MSKTTKIIAALGVVAGLGVAALPAFTFATDPSVSGDVQVLVEVEPAIAMAITGNNDSGTNAQNDSYVAVPAEDITVGTTDVSNYYTYNAGAYTKATGTAVADTTYYQKAGTPTFGEADAYSPSGATSVAGHSVSGYTLNYAANTSSAYVKLLPNSAIEGDRSAQSPSNNFGSTITVWTNNVGGYALSVKDKDDSTALMHTTGADNIPTGSGAVSGGTAKWNFDSTTGSDSSYEGKTAQAMPAASADGVVINQTGDKTTSAGSVTTVDYNVATSASQTQGIYSDTIVYTATTVNN